MIFAEPLEREIYIIVSTAHISVATAMALPELPIICDATEHRFRIPLKSALEEAAALPGELVTLLTTIAAAAPDAYGIMLDCDGPVIPGLATFDW